MNVLPFGGLTPASGEVTARLGCRFEITRIAGTQHLRAGRAAGPPTL